MLRIALALFLARSLVGAYLVPPWSNPDEPSHFGYVRLLAFSPGGGWRPEDEARVEGEILQSMARVDWWRQYPQEKPTRIPSRFQDVSSHVTAIGGAVQPLYFRFAAAPVRVLRIRGLLEQYYTLRMLSVLCAALTIVCAWAGARLLLDPASAGVVAAVLALQPQFLLVALTVGPDMLVNLLGAVIWWQAARLLVRPSALIPIAIMLSCAAAIVFTKRLGAPVSAAVIVILALHFLRLLHGHWRGAVMVLALLAAAIAGLALVAWLMPDEIAVLRYSWGLFFRSPEQWPPKVRSVEYFREYTVQLVRSAWLVAGWLRYPAPSWWFVVASGLTVAGVLGTIVALIRKRRRPEYKGILLAAGLALVQIIAVYATTYLTAYGGQGRYLFPVAAPLALLLWIGFAEYWPARLRSHAAPTLIALMFALDLSGWLTVLLPAYVY
jgi:hypothetical protein